MHTARNKVRRLFRRNAVAPGMAFFPAVLRGVLVCTLALTTAGPAAAQASQCVRSTYIPGWTPLLLQHPDGRYIHLQADSMQYRRGAHLWVNGVYEAFYFIPFTVFSADEIRVELNQSLRSDIWNGVVRSPILRQTPIVIVCNGWFGDLR